MMQSDHQARGDEYPLGSVVGSPTSASTGGIALPTRQASITLLRDEAQGPASASASGSNLRRQDSLEGTKNFYGLNPSSPPSTHRPLSSTSRHPSQKRLRSNSNAASSTISATRQNTVVSPTSPPRASVPLPTPRGFLSPKKPASAIRLENKKYTSSSISNRSSLPKESYYESSTPSRLTHRSSRELESDARTQTASLDHDPLAAGGDHHHSLNANAAVAMVDDGSGAREAQRTGWDKSWGRSVTEESSLPGQFSELSSDELVGTHRAAPNPTPDKPNPNGVHQFDTTNKDIERGYPQPQNSLIQRTKGKPKRSNRKYQTLQNPLTTFFCSGHLMTGGDAPWSMALITVLLLGISGVWLGTTGAWMWVHGREYGLVKGAGVGITVVFVYLFCLVSSSLLAAAFRDPGIIPRNLDPDPPLQDIDEEWCEAWPRELTVNGARVTVKYCETCQSYRPPRSSHCRLCGNCVDGIDHHCSYLHTCVGKRNYFSFLVLLISASISDIYIVIFSALHFSLICHHKSISFGKALSESPGAAVSFLLGILTLGPILFLLWYHLRLLLYNITTVEQIRASASNNLLITRHRPDNPFGDRSIWRNVVLASLARPQFPSWIDASGYEREEKREVNPALVDPKWREGGGGFGF